MSFWDLLGWSDRRSRTADGADTGTIRKIVDRLNDLEPERARFIAAFACVLSRVAGADMRISDEETRAMESIVARRGHLPEEQAVLVVQIAKTQNLLLGGTENFLVTRELDRVTTREQKLALLDCLFAVAGSDRSITSVEERVLRQIAAELRLERRHYTAVRSRHREKRTVLRDGSGDSAEDEDPGKGRNET